MSGMDYLLMGLGIGLMFLGALGGLGLFVWLSTRR